MGQTLKFTGETYWSVGNSIMNNSKTTTSQESLPQQKAASLELSAWPADTQQIGNLFSRQLFTGSITLVGDLVNLVSLDLNLWGLFPESLKPPTSSMGRNCCTSRSEWICGFTRRNMKGGLSIDSLCGPLKREHWLPFSISFYPEGYFLKST